MWIKSPILRILTITQRVTQREIYVHTIRLTQRVHYNTWIGAFTQRYTTLLLKVLLLVPGVYAYSFLEHGLDSPKGNPPKKRSQNSPEFCYTFYDHRGWSTSRHPSVRLGVVSCKNHTSHYVRVTQARKSTRIRSLNDVLSLLSFTSPLDPLRSRVAPFTFFNRYTHSTHTHYTSYLHHVLSLVLTLLCHHVNSYIFSYLRIWTPTTTP